MHPKAGNPLKFHIHPMIKLDKMDSDTASIPAASPVKAVSIGAMNAL
jgi:hypothetical protein